MSGSVATGRALPSPTGEGLGSRRAVASRSARALRSARVVARGLSRLRGQERADTLAALRHLPRALAAAAAIELVLGRVPLARLTERLGFVLDERREAESGEATSSETLGRACVGEVLAARAALLLLGLPPTCLRRSLVAGHLLRRREPRLRIGARLTGGAVTAHAWLELAGARLPGDEAEGFSPLGRAP